MENPEESKKPIHKDAGAIKKLSGCPVKVEIQIPTLEENESGDVEYVKKDVIDGWLHPLSVIERNHVRAAVVDAIRLCKAEGSEKTEIYAAIEGIRCTYTVFFSLRRSGEKGSRRFFDTSNEASNYPTPLLQDLARVYDETFELTSEEWGNFLRARS